MASILDTNIAALSAEPIQAMRRPLLSLAVLGAGDRLWVLVGLLLLVVLVSWGRPYEVTTRFAQREFDEDEPGVAGRLVVGALRSLLGRQPFRDLLHRPPSDQAADPTHDERGFRKRAAADLMMPRDAEQVLGATGVGVTLDDNLGETGTPDLGEWIGAFWVDVGVPGVIRSPASDTMTSTAQQQWLTLAEY